MMGSDQLLERIGSTCAVLEVLRRREGYLHVSVARQDVLSLLIRARGEMGYRILQLISVVDRIEDGEFQLTYILEELDDSSILIISALFPREDCTVPSICGIWPAAETFERELHEMYGIDFPGNSRQGEEFILEGWSDIPPMRRDFDTLEYSMRMFGERWPRDHHDPRRFVGERVGEWDTPMSGKEEG